MAGDWIKMRSKLHDDPNVMRLMTATGLDRFAIVGRLHAFWSWTDEHADIDENGNGHVTGIALQHIDSLVTHPGFADALVLIGWLEVDGDRGLNIPRYASHNGDTAKKRAQGNKRVQLHRERNAVVTPLKRSQRDKSVTKEEKRREEEQGRAPSAPRSTDPIFGAGVEFLMSRGDSEKNAKSFFGKLISEWDERAVSDAITAAFSAKGDPKGYIRKVLESKPKKVKPPPGADLVLADLRSRYGDAVVLRSDQRFYDRASGRVWAIDGQQLAAV